jgi:hypothetical protein
MGNKVIHMSNYPKFGRPRLLRPDRPRCEVIESCRKKFVGKADSENPSYCPLCGLRAYDEESARMVQRAWELDRRLDNLVERVKGFRGRSDGDGKEVQR